MKTKRKITQREKYKKMALNGPDTTDIYMEYKKHLELYTAFIQKIDDLCK